MTIAHKYDHPFYKANALYESGGAYARVARSQVTKAQHQLVRTYVSHNMS